ncbi:MAG: hypothetical protein KatS3mg032_0750 [Cyclobacteriaceae bacterium]|nr:MAG: hypothetical protein KatS3mg032_0750 [Cyclobacteriaceae bacterium]
MSQVFDFLYAGISFGSYESGTYGGSVHKRIHPNVYQYWYLHAGHLSDKGLRYEFEKKFAEFLNSTTVNQSVSLINFLSLIEANDSGKLSAVYAKYKDRVEVGSHIQPLSVLIFRKNEADAPIELDPNQCQLTGPQTHAFFEWVRQHGKHVKSEVPDMFMHQYYKRFIVD